jgi:HAD superfamily hydrolase (TIGR01509 family)
MFEAKTKPAAVLFDLDGTLIDSEYYWMASERALAERHGKEWNEDHGKELIGLSLYESSKLIKSRLESDLEPEEIIRQLTDSVNNHLQTSVPWRPGAKELLLLLRESGVKTALVTMSMRRTALQVVNAIGFEAFDVVVAGDDVVRGKPDPEPYLKAAELLGVSAKDCVAFEDSVNGLTSAEAANTKAVGIPNMMNIPAQPGRILWETLDGVTIADLQRLFRDE